jgi:hypothetical protein
MNQRVRRGLVALGFGAVAAAGMLLPATAAQAYSNGNHQCTAQAETDTRVGLTCYVANLVNARAEVHCYNATGSITVSSIYITGGYTSKTCPLGREVADLRIHWTDGVNSPWAYPSV